jgi:putative ABC transport system permease protein
LTSFSVERRFKEIGIRKVLGASVSGVVALIAREFMRWIVVSFIIAIPVTYWVVDLWLRNFTSRIAIDPLTFALAGAAVMGVAGLVISYLSARAALANPVESLRTE